MKNVTIDPVEVATKLAHQRTVDELVCAEGKGSVKTEEELFTKEGEYKTWVMVIYLNHYEYYFKIITDNVVV